MDKELFITIISENQYYLGSRLSHTRDYICIPDAQYYELSAQQNLWCEILEF